MAVELKVPPLGESITEAVISKWNKKQGESVAAEAEFLRRELRRPPAPRPSP